MEARVDVRKLQILNDRINQTIDALNQVRLSVHGLGHTPGMQGQQTPLNLLAQGYGQQAYGQSYSPFGLGGGPGMFPGIGGPMPGLQQGIPGVTQPFGFQHSPFTPYLNPFTNPGVLPPWGIGLQSFGTPWSGLAGVGAGGGGVGGGGLFHAGQDVIEKQLAEVRASDPYRITQTFPFVIS